MKKFIEHDGKKIEVNVHGTGKPVYIMLAGWTHDFQYEDNLIHTLPQIATVITISYPGYSGSDENSKAQSANFLSTIISSVIEELRLTHFTLVGFSMGCQIVLRYIKNHPKQKAVLLSPVLHSLLADTPSYGKILLSSKFLLQCIRSINPIKKYLVNLAYSKISNVTEGRNNDATFEPTRVTVNGAFDTLIATISSFIDPIEYRENVQFIFGDREISQNKLDQYQIPYRLIRNAGHETFEKNFKQVAKLITSYI